VVGGRKSRGAEFEAIASSVQQSKRRSSGSNKGAPRARRRSVVQ
jgi:hypothetical protein